MTNTPPPTTHRFANRDGCPIAFDVAGTGPAVLMIQGVGVQGDGWLPQVDGLADRFTCVRFDNRGNGRSAPADRSLSIRQMADDAIAVMDAAGLSSAHLLGHSLGGLITLDLAIRAPDRVKSLALLCTFADGRLAAPLTPRMMWYGARSRMGTRSMRRAGFLKLLLAPGVRVDPNVENSRLAPLFGHDLGDQPTIVGMQLKAMRAANYGERLDALPRVPTLVMSARHDLIAVPRLGRALADGIEGARFIEVADASHGLPITHARQVNTLLSEHWQ